MKKLKYDYLHIKREVLDCFIDSILLSQIFHFEKYSLSPFPTNLSNHFAKIKKNK